MHDHPNKNNCSRTARPRATPAPCCIPLHWFKRALWVLVVASGLLAVTGVLEAGAALVLVGLLEAAALLLGLVLLTRALRETRRSDQSWSAAILAALSALLPDQLARFIVLELRTVGTLARWSLHRFPAPARSFTYRKRSMLGLLLLVVLLTTPGELLLFHVLLPWTWARWLLAAVSLYALLWLLALWASLRVHPHEIANHTLVLRWLYLHEVPVPLDTVHSVVIRSERAPSGRDGLIVRGDTAWLAVGGHTDVLLELVHPVCAYRFLRPFAPVRRIHVAVDDPARFARTVAEVSGANETPVVPA